MIYDERNVSLLSLGKDEHVKYVKAKNLSNWMINLFEDIVTAGIMQYPSKPTALISAVAKVVRFIDDAFYLTVVGLGDRLNSDQKYDKLRYTYRNSKPDWIPEGMYKILITGPEMVPLFGNQWSDAIKFYMELFGGYEDDYDAKKKQQRLRKSGKSSTDQISLDLDLDINMDMDMSF